MEKGMIRALLVVVCMISACWVGSSEGAVFKVGDSVGWTILGNPNYTAWSLNNTFHVGDTLVFEYNNKFHNVMEVNKMDYRTCNASAPKKTYTTGNDSITITRKGHYFFICGIPGHCMLGQKVDIRIPKLRPSVSPSPSPSMFPLPSTAPPAQPSSAHCGNKGVGLVLALVAMGLFYNGVSIEAF